MNVLVEPLPNCLTTLRIELDPEQVSQAREKLIQEFGKTVKIAGYRAGKVPRAVVEKRFKKQIREELEGKLLRESAREAIAEKKLRVLQIASVDDIEIGEDNRMSYTATVVTQPEFEVPNYKGIPIETPSSEVTDADIDKSLEELREQSADFADITGRGAEMGDFVVVNYQGTIDGKPVHEVFPKAGKPLSENEDFWIKMTEEAFFPGYCGSLLGIKEGETREFDVEVPSDFPVEGMPGTKIHYTVTLKGLKAKTLPEMNDEFAHSVLEGRTMAQLRDLARVELVTQKTAEVQGSKINQVMKFLLSGVECELPASMVRAETQHILGEIVRENQSRGISADVLKGSEKELVGLASQNAREKVKGNFILHRIAELEGIKVKREEVLGRVAGMARQYKMTFEKMIKELEKSNGFDKITEEILTAKTLDFLITNASVPGVPATT